ncbi:head-tail adaptor protein [Streptomyces antimycoticus]|uniref:head-tail adaptor protein n=1 Tax=Streptomyces antimycoticus TaxID=68175 RepID=UPI002570C9F0|nr:head-tail adaptor protein [Streptomyces antimycoticus]WJD99769.1 head-tail adaptor protein [Streptomyces antimycoticus]
MSRVGRLLNTTAEVWRATTEDDGGGGQSTTWALQSTQRARLSQPSARERQAADQSSADLTHIVYLTPGVDVRRKDELRRDGLVLEVTATFEPSEPGTYLRADCTARQPTS